jgi:hypothetical protein
MYVRAQSASLKKVTCSCRIEGQGGDSYAQTHSHWRRKRHWFAPQPHRLLTHAEPLLAFSHQRRGVIDFEAALGQAAAAFLPQHRVSGRSLLPGAAMLECCFAAACMLAGQTSQICSKTKKLVLPREMRASGKMDSGLGSYKHPFNHSSRYL